MAPAAAATAGAQQGGAARVSDGVSAADGAARPRHGAVAPRAQGDRHSARGGAAAARSGHAAAPLDRGLICLRPALGTFVRLLWRQRCVSTGLIPPRWIP